MRSVSPATTSTAMLRQLYSEFRYYSVSVTNLQLGLHRTPNLHEKHFHKTP
uniref:Uncharacterized protein n=1 Tax=Arundo donax TaxID=35708 RepID=A0A0A8XNY3_ARUDO